MEESGKGNAAGPSTKNSSASLDDDFGKDFLNSWKPSKFGNDSMDFDVQPMNGKNKKFSFGKLDDFDLGADFDKLPSFKMDMSDLDFSSPVKKTGTKPSSSEKSNNESHLGKKGQEKDKFSFSFDFDELGKFDLEPQVSNGEKIEKKKNTQAQPTTSMTSLDLNKTKTQNQNQNQNSTTDTNKNTLKPETSSKSNNSTENINNTQTKQPSESISNGSNSSRKTNPIITREESKEFSLHSISGTSSSRRFRESIDKPEKRDTTSAQSMGSSSQSRNNSPVVSISSATKVESKEKDRPNNNLGPNRNSDCDKILNPVTRLGNSNPGKEKLSILYKSQQNSILSMKQSSDLNSKKIEGMNLQSSEMRRDSKQPDIQRQTEISKTGLLTTLEKPSTKGISFGTGNSKIDPENRTFSTLRTTSNLINNNSLLKDEKQTLVSRLLKMNQRSPTTTVEKDFNSAKSSETNTVSLSPKNKTPTAPVPKQNPSFLSPSLKRKASEESVEDPFTRSNPLKRISSNLPVQTRKSPEIERTKIQEDLNKCSLSPNLLTLIERKIPDFEMPVLLENNCNVEKAEAISKDLDDICSMLKKKQEEAKELLVRAVVNNNKLLMLNHPIYDDKLHALESFAANLRAKHLVS